MRAGNVGPIARGASMCEVKSVPLTRLLDFTEGECGRSALLPPYRRLCAPGLVRQGEARRTTEGSL